MLRFLLIICLLCGSIAGSAAADAADRLVRAMVQVERDNWSAALEQAGRKRSLGWDIIQWQRLRAGQGSAREVMDFLKRHPDWPGLAWLRRNSESAMAGAQLSDIRAFYGAQEPRTAEGALSYARALKAGGKRKEAEAQIIRAWRTMPMGASVQAEFLRSYGKILKKHHEARLDRLLWDGHDVSAPRMYDLVSKDQRNLAKARIALQKRARGVDALIAAVPGNLRSAPGLSFERFVWRDRKGLDDSAIELLLQHSASAETLGVPGKWAPRRRDLARQVMRRGDPKLAYRIASQHHLTEGSSYSDLEWLSGFLALRKLGDPALALTHFQRFDASIVSPISKGRAGYWLGRAHEALGDADKAQEAYALGARYQTSFYGLLAAERIGRPFDPALSNPPKVPSWRKASFMQASVLEAGLLLLSADEPVLAERFLTHLAEGLSDVQAVQLGDMAIDLGQPHLAVMIAKRVAQRGLVIPGAYYPLHPVARQELPMAPEMTLSIARRESEFDPVVISHAGARGLMQVMPKTARLVAGNLGILRKHSTGRLTSDWPYNARLGAQYLAGLADTFDGNVVMMSAGYNAGPARPKRWMANYGDPRRGDIDIVDWVETIPFNETRNYVMRVTESLPVYRARLGKPALPVPFSRELTGSTLSAFAQ